jgi:hypothetical protein
MLSDIGSNPGCHGGYRVTSNLACGVRYITINIGTYKTVILFALLYGFNRYIDGLQARREKNWRSFAHNVEAAFEIHPIYTGELFPGNMTDGS